MSLALFERYISITLIPATLDTTMVFPHTTIAVRTDHMALHTSKYEELELSANPTVSGITKMTERTVSVDYKKRELEFAITNRSDKMQVVNETRIIGYDYNGDKVVDAVDATHRILYPSHDLEFRVTLDEQVKGVDKVIVVVDGRLVAESKVRAR